MKPGDDEHRPLESPAYRRRTSLIDLISSCPGLVFWMASYFPPGVIASLLLNSPSPLIIALCLAYLTNQSLDD